MMNCMEATRLISEAQDRRLSLQERMALKLHTSMCSGCRNFSRQAPLLGQAARVYAKGDDTESDDHPR